MLAEMPNQLHLIIQNDFEQSHAKQIIRLPASKIQQQDYIPINEFHRSPCEGK